MNEERDIFDRIKEILIGGFDSYGSNYRKRVNMYTDKDLVYFGGKAQQVGVTCMECVALNNCVFYFNKLSTYDHRKCKCLYLPCSNVEFVGEIPIRKIVGYLMINESKKVIFERLGYSIEDSEYLKDTISESAVDSYKKGKYVIKDLDEYGQRLGIETIVPSKDKKRFIKFYSGWKLFPNGRIINTTPFGGWLKEKIL